MPAISLAGSRAEASTTRLPGVTYTNETYTLQLIQPLFRWSGWQTYEQSKLQLAVGEAQLAQGRQDLILRVAQAYFDVLSAQDNLAFIGAQKIAISEQLESAKRNFEIGTATITDTYEAQARYDLAQAQEIQAESDLAVRIGALQQIIGAPSGDLAKLPPAVNVPAPQPARIDAWTEQATANNLAVAQATLNSEIAQRGIEIAKSGHYPSFDLTANVARTRGWSGRPWSTTSTPRARWACRSRCPSSPVSAPRPRWTKPSRCPRKPATISRSPAGPPSRTRASRSRA